MAEKSRSQLVGQYNAAVANGLVQEARRIGGIIDALPAEPVRPAGYPYGEFDAHRWADEFLRIYPDASSDHDTMLGWFANAIMTGYDERDRDVETAYDVGFTSGYEQAKEETE